METITDEILEMYNGRVQRGEINKFKAVTVEQHGRQIYNLDKIITGKFNKEGIKSMVWLSDMDPKEILKVIMNIPGRGSPTIGIATQNSYMGSVLVCLRVKDFNDFHKSPMWKFFHTQMNDKNSEHRVALAEKKLDKGFVPEYDDIMKVVNDYIFKGEDLYWKILLMIYTKYPFRLEAVEAQYLKNKSQYKKMLKKEVRGNYLVKMSGSYYFSLHDYKTSEIYGERLIEVKDKVIKDYIATFTKNMDDYQDLFHITRNTFSKAITTFFKNNGIPGVNPTNLSKMIITREYDQMPDDLKKMQEKIAKERGHSINSQIAAYVVARD